MGSAHQPVIVDVIVVGAGVIGLATAWELRRRGMTVAVVDPHPGAGASRAAAGMLASASETWYQQSALLTLMTASATQYPEFVRRIEDAADARIGYRRTETLVCAAHPADRRALADLQRFQLQQGLQVEELSGRSARSLEPALSPRLCAAFRAAGDHQIDPRRLLSGLISALERSATGSDTRVIRERVQQLLRGSGGEVIGVLLADDRRVLAAETVLATGSDLQQLPHLPEAAALPLRRVHGDILRTRIPRGAAPLIERTVRGLVNGTPVYVVPRVDGEIVIGATMREDALEGPSVGGVSRILRDAQTLVPGVTELELIEMMARARPATTDDMPILGRLAATDGSLVPGLIVSTGYFRHGVLLAPLAARLAARIVAKEPAPKAAAQDTHRDQTFLDLVDPRRFLSRAESPPRPNHADSTS